MHSKLYRETTLYADGLVNFALKYFVMYITAPFKNIQSTVMNYSEGTLFDF